MGPNMHNVLGCSQVDEGLPEVCSVKWTIHEYREAVTCTIKKLPILFWPGQRLSKKLLLFRATCYSHRSTNACMCFIAEKLHISKKNSQTARYCQMWRVWKQLLYRFNRGRKRSQDEQTLHRGNVTQGLPLLISEQAEAATANVGGRIWHHHLPRITSSSWISSPLRLPCLSPPLFSQVAALPSPPYTHLLLQHGNSPIKADSCIMWGLADRLREFPRAPLHLQHTRMQEISNVKITS